MNHSTQAAPNGPPLAAAIKAASMGVRLPEGMPWKDFLENCPPGEVRTVNDYKIVPSGGFIVPDLELFCGSEKCGRKQVFSGKANGIPYAGDCYFYYTCRNCALTKKTFAIRLIKDSDPGEAVKFGEMPPFGAPIPAKLQRLIQPHRDFFLKGYRCENQGLGIAAFSYYRRVVEGEKDRLFDEIIKVCQKVQGGESLIPKLVRAKKNHQFSKAVEEISDAIPDALRISGHNPLTLLHSALSKHIHNESDEACLEAAQAIRVVLTDLAERMSEILKENAELTRAIEKLMPKPASVAPSKASDIDTQK